MIVISHLGLIKYNSYLIKIIQKRDIVAFNRYETIENQNNIVLKKENNILLTKIIANPTDLKDTICVYNLTTSTDGAGTGAKLSLNISGNTVTGITVINTGENYAAGDRLIVSGNTIPNDGLNNDLIILLDNSCFKSRNENVNYITFENSEPLSITNRILSSYIDSTSSHNLIRELEIFNKYSLQNYSNRIIKLKFVQRQ